MMEYTESVDHDRRIVFGKTTGALTVEELGPKTLGSRTRAKELDYLLLLDFSDSPSYISIVDAFHWISDHYDPVDKTLRDVPTVHVVGDLNENFFSRVEMMWKAQGVEVKVFRDRDAAIQWLEAINAAR